MCSCCGWPAGTHSRRETGFRCYFQKLSYKKIVNCLDVNNCCLKFVFLMSVRIYIVSKCCAFS